MINTDDIIDTLFSDGLISSRVVETRKREGEKGRMGEE
jgi:hypothetical protein